MAADDPIHPVLVRQLRRAGVEPPRGVNSPLRELLRLVSSAYREHEESQYLSERALEISTREMTELNARLVAERNRLEAELAVARDLQTSMLPHDHATPGWESAGRMVAATEAGGDYFDVIPTDDGCWIAIGDVAGHGLRAAVTMTMVQSMVAVLIRQAPAASPRELVITLNRAIHDNVFQRLRTRDHVTFTLMHCHRDGRVVHAGAHEELLVCRARTGACERVATSGTWLGPIADISPHTVDLAFQLDPDDLLVLYTDGITEARNAQGEQLGLDRLVQLVQSLHHEPVAAIADRILEITHAWTRDPDDDLSVLAFRKR